MQAANLYHFRWPDAPGNGKGDWNWPPVSASGLVWVKIASAHPQILDCSPSDVARRGRIDNRKSGIYEEDIDRRRGILLN